MQARFLPSSLRRYIQKSTTVHPHPSAVPGRCAFRSSSHLQPHHPETVCRKDGCRAERLRASPPACRLPLPFQGCPSALFLPSLVPVLLAAAGNRYRYAPYVLCTPRIYFCSYWPPSHGCRPPEIGKRQICCIMDLQCQCLNYLHGLILLSQIFGRFLCVPVGFLKSSSHK